MNLKTKGGEEKKQQREVQAGESARNLEKVTPEGVSATAPQAAQSTAVASGTNRGTIVNRRDNKYQGSSQTTETAAGTTKSTQPAGQNQSQIAASVPSPKAMARSSPTSQAKTALPKPVPVVPALPILPKASFKRSPQTDTQKRAEDVKKPSEESSPPAEKGSRSSAISTAETARSPKASTNTPSPKLAETTENRQQVDLEKAPPSPKEKQSLKDTQHLEQVSTSSVTSFPLPSIILCKLYLFSIIHLIWFIYALSHPGFHAYNNTQSKEMAPKGKGKKGKGSSRATTPSVAPVEETKVPDSVTAENTSKKAPSPATEETPESDTTGGPTPCNIASAPIITEATTATTTPAVVTSDNDIPKITSEAVTSDGSSSSSVEETPAPAEGEKKKKKKRKNRKKKKKGPKGKEKEAEGASTPTTTTADPVTSTGSANVASPAAGTSGAGDRPVFGPPRPPGMLSSASSPSPVAAATSSPLVTALANLAVAAARSGGGGSGGGVGAGARCGASASSSAAGGPGASPGPSTAAAAGAARSWLESFGQHQAAIREAAQARDLRRLAEAMDRVVEPFRVDGSDVFMGANEPDEDFQEMLRIRRLTDPSFDPSKFRYNW
ncbi:hypothetical protein VTK73DRAFT_9029 [Phialemonium thermophilum]|uniref:Uncharacterized protein n=1 Tax=Phialemonium thermophilum TaxID=223376 RepID=A0ABR3XLK7_9PEZI